MVTASRDVVGSYVYFTKESYFSWRDTRLLDEKKSRELLLRQSFGNWCAKNGW